MVDPCLFHNSLTMVDHGQPLLYLTFMVDHGQTIVISLPNHGRPLLETVFNHGKTMVELGLSMVLLPGAKLLFKLRKDY